MPGQLRLTGANAAYILEGSDTITEDVVVKFPEDGNYVTEDSDGNVDLDGNVNARAVLVDMLDGEESATSKAETNRDTSKRKATPGKRNQ